MLAPILSSEHQLGSDERGDDEVIRFNHIHDGLRVGNHKIRDRNKCDYCVNIHKHSNTLQGMYNCNRAAHREITVYPHNRYNTHYVHYIKSVIYTCKSMKDIDTNYLNKMLMLLKILDVIHIAPHFQDTTILKLNPKETRDDHSTTYKKVRSKSEYINTDSDNP